MKSKEDSYRWVVLALATAVQITISMIQQAPAALGPVLSRELGLSSAQIGLLSSAIIGGMALTTLPMGLLIDRYGERGMMLAGVSVTCIIVVCATRATTFGWLFILFLIASFGASASTTGGSKTITDWFSGSQRGTAMGIRQTGIPAGGLLAALLFPAAALWISWSFALVSASIIALLTAVCFALFHRSPTDNSSTDQLPASRVSLSTIIRNRSFLGATGYSLSLVGVQWSVTAYLTIFLHEKIGLSVLSSGLLLAVLQVAGIAGRIGWSLASDLLARRKSVMVCLGCIAILGCLAMSTATQSTPLPLLVSFVVILGCSLLSWNGIYITMIAESAPSASSATAIGAGLTGTNIGTFCLPPVFGAILDASGSYQLLWFCLSAAAAAGTLMVCMAHEMNSDPPASR